MGESSDITEDYAHLFKDCHWRLDDGVEGHVQLSDKYWSFRARCSDCEETIWLNYKINDLLKLLQKK